MSSPSSIAAPSTAIPCNNITATATTIPTTAASPTGVELMDAKGSTEDSLISTNASVDVSSKVFVDTVSSLCSNNPQEVDDSKITCNQSTATPGIPQKNDILLLQKSLQNLELRENDPTLDRELSDQTPSSASPAGSTSKDGDPQSSERERKLGAPIVSGESESSNGSVRLLSRNGDGPPGNTPSASTNLQEASPIIVVSSQPQPAEPFATQLNMLANVIDEPDQRLLDALENPRDRLFVIKLEQDIVNFIRENNCEIFDLPPINAYHRLLTHKMAEYYRLTHVADATGSSVRLYRGQFARIPPVRLSERQVASSSRDSPSNNTVPTVKIMKRTHSERGTDTPPDQSNSTPKKPSSESSSGDGSSKATTREEREAAYQEARARIFKDFVEPPDVPQVKPNDKQKKFEKPDDFSTRSQFFPVVSPASQVASSYYSQFEDPRYHVQTGAHMAVSGPARFNATTPSFAPSPNFMPQGYSSPLQNRQIHPHIERSYSPLGRSGIPSQQMFPQRNGNFPDSNHTNGYKMIMPPVGNPYYPTHPNTGYSISPQSLHNTPPTMSSAPVHRQATTPIPYPVNGQTLAPRFPQGGLAWNAPTMGGVPMTARSSSGPAAPDRHTLPFANIPYQNPYQPHWGANGGLPKGGYNLGGGMHHGPVGGM